MADPPHDGGALRYRATAGPPVSSVPIAGRMARAQPRAVAAERAEGVAQIRDIATTARDDAADARDLAVARHDVVYEQQDPPYVATGADILLRAATQRHRATAQSASAVADREQVARWLDAQGSGP